MLLCLITYVSVEMRVLVLLVRLKFISVLKAYKGKHLFLQVFDCWFESGSMPYAQLHYPFENKEKFERNFPADFIAEGLDQVRA